MTNFIFLISYSTKKIVQSNTHKILLKMNNFKKLLYKSNILNNPPILFHARSQSSKSDIFFIYRRTTEKNIVFRSCILILVSPSMTYVAQVKETHPIADTRTECTTVTDKWLSIMIYTRRNNSRPRLDRLWRAP